jgi:type III secretion system low calcium response chaperone LcrH/SycD
MAVSQAEAEQAVSAIMKQMMGGATLAELAAIPPAEIEALYTEAYEHVQREEFDAAIDPLLALVISNPYDFRFQFGYALCLHQLGRTEDAAKHYGLAYVLDPSDAGCAFRLGECLAAMGDREAATEAFESAIALCNPPGPNHEIRVASSAALVKLNS